MYLLILPNWSGKKLRLQCVDLWEVCEVHWLYASINNMGNVYLKQDSSISYGYWAVSVKRI